MQSDFSEIPLFTGYLSFLNNITAFIRQTELCGAPHNSVCLMKVIMLMYSLPVAEDRHFLLNLLHIMYQLQSFRIAEYFAKVRPYIFVSFI